MKQLIGIIFLSLISLGFSQTRAGSGAPIAGTHPSYTVTDIRPSTGTTVANGTPWPNTGGALAFPVGAMGFMSDGRLVVTSWRDPYEVFIISKDILGATPKSATVTKFATGLVEALGLEIVNDSIYVLEKDQVTLLLDNDKDGMADEYRAISYDWTKSVNSKEYAFGLPYDGTWFYAGFGDPTISNATAIDPAPAGRQNGVLRFKKDGTTEVFAAGVRVPSGFSHAFGTVWLSEIQGGYRPSSVVYNPKQGAFYGRPINPPAVYQPLTVPIPKVDSFPYDSPALTAAAAHPFVLNIPFKNTGVSGAGPIGYQRSTAQVVEIKTGPFAGQMLVAESDNGETGSGEMVRAFIEQTADGEYQGGVFHFISNKSFGGTTAPSGFSRNACMAFIPGPDGNFYCAGNGATAAGWSRATSVGLDRISLSTAATPFDMVSVSTTGPNTFEFKFTQPLAASLGNDVSANLTVNKWWDRMSDEYGCCRVGVDAPATRAIKTVATVTGGTATVQTDRTRVIVTYPAGTLTAHWQYYFRWADAIKNESAQTLYGAEVFYTLNAFGPATAPVSIETAHPAEMGAFHVSSNYTGLTVQTIFKDGKPFTANILDLRGKVITSHSGHGSEQFMFERNSLPVGTYVLMLQHEGKIYSRLGIR